MDGAKLEQFMGAVVGHMTGAMVCFGVWVGGELGVWREMAGAGPMSAEAVAKGADTNPRLTLEWLNGQAAAGMVAHDAGAGTYELSAEAAMALSDETSPVFVARGMATLASMFIDLDK